MVKNKKTLKVKNQITHEDIKLKVQLKPLLPSNQSQKFQNPRKITLQNKALQSRKSKRPRPTKSSHELAKQEKRSKPIQRKASNKKGHKSKAELREKSRPKRLLKSLLTH